MTSDTSAQGLKSSAASPLVKLCRMLRSMLRRYPQARLWNTLDGFGVLLDEQHSMRLSFTGNWTDADMRDCLALFATWLVADPARLHGRGVRLDGVLQMVDAESKQ